MRRSYDWLGAQTDSASDELSPLLGGQFAATHGLSQDTERWVHRYDLLIRRDLEAGDSEGARRGEESKRVIRSHLAESRSDTGAVLRELRRGISIYPSNVGTKVFVGRLLRFDLARRLVAAGDYTTAQRYLDSFDRWGMALEYFIGPIELLRGQVAEALNDTKGARTHYANLVRWWKDCDPDLVPVREEARGALVRLSTRPASTQ
jgi:hypothetical protein